MGSYVYVVGVWFEHVYFSNDTKWLCDYKNNKIKSELNRFIDYFLFEWPLSRRQLKFKEWIEDTSLLAVLEIAAEVNWIMNTNKVT